MTVPVVERRWCKDVLFVQVSQKTFREVRRIELDVLTVQNGTPQFEQALKQSGRLSQPSLVEPFDALAANRKQLVSVDLICDLEQISDMFLAVNARCCGSNVFLRVAYHPFSYGRAPVVAFGRSDDAGKQLFTVFTCHFIHHQSQCT